MAAEADTPTPDMPAPPDMPAQAIPAAAIMLRAATAPRTTAPTRVAWRTTPPGARQALRRAATSWAARLAELATTCRGVSRRVAAGGRVAAGAALGVAATGAV